MVNKIAHLADCHIRKSTARHKEYREVFKELYNRLKIDNPDRICIVGDLFHDYIKLEGEVLVLASEFLNNLSKIAPIVITRGNHDIARSAPNRTDAIEALVRVMDNKNITYYNKTGLYNDENIVWAVWKHGEKNNNPWPKNYQKDSNKIYIDLFHDPVNGARNSEGYEFSSKTYHAITDYMGDISMFGDIHMLQYLDPIQTKAYPSSLIEQNFGEGDEQFHGYLLWDLKTKIATEVKIDNPYGHFTIDLNRFTDFDNLQLNINSTIPHKRIRIKWKTLPGMRTIENMRKVDTLLQNKFAPLSIKHINDFIEEKKITIEEKGDIENIGKREVIHKIITEYLKKIGHKDEVIQDLLDLDVEIENRLTIENLTNIQWSILKFGGKNFRSYENIEIDWDQQDGLYQIVGENGVGKSSINQLITYTLFGKSLETDFRKKFGDARFLNNKLNTSTCEGWVIFEANGEYYGIKRTTTVKKNKEAEINGASTVGSYYKLTSPNDKLEDRFNIDKLNDIDKAKTQVRIDEIIGTYENFIRVTLTTSDTLNDVLSSDAAPFIDSLLYDSGLDIFDLRAKEFKNYKDELIIDRSLANFKVQDSENTIIALNSNIKLKNELIDSTNNKINLQRQLLDSFEKQKDLVQQSMHQIDCELGNTNETIINQTIINLNKDLTTVANEETTLTKTINSLKSTYAAEELESLLKKKENHKNEEFEKRTAINKKRMEIEQLKSTLSRINTEIEMMKREGVNYKKEIATLEQNKVCSQCNQTIEKDEHKAHIKKTIAEKEKLMFAVADKIRAKTIEPPTILTAIAATENTIKKIEEEIKNLSIDFQSVLERIGIINNDKIEFEKRERLALELKAYPLKKDNLNMKINDQQEKLKRFNDQKVKIEENNGLRKQVVELSGQIQIVQSEIDYFKNSIIDCNSIIKQNKQQIQLHEQAIKNYLVFERQELVRKLYAETIHRDGLPTQILTDTLLPKINNVLSKLLETTDFDVYLDKDDLRLKFFYNDHPNAIIDAVSSSGMERTFAVFALKIALNQINQKSKSTILSIDEIMGKLTTESFEKFLVVLHESKKFYKKILVIEHNEVNADYLLEIIKDKSGVSKIINEIK